MASVWDCGDAVWHDSLNAIVSAFAAFLAAGLRPRTTLAKAIMLVLIIGSGIGLAAGLLMLARSHGKARRTLTVPAEWEDRMKWRMPPLHLVGKPVVSTPRKIGLVLLRGYLLVAFILVIVKVVEVAIK